MEVYRGDIFYGRIPKEDGSVQGGTRPVVVLQNDIGNKYSPTVIIAKITSQINKANIPTHVKIKKDGLKNESVIMLEQIATLDKKDLLTKVDSLDFRELRAVEKALKISMGLVS
ncbi:MAG: type II toxin-antitoxin system PemK/MazF family toxin [Clostridium sp.]|nr:MULTISPECIES: type II toxin-antitoxin system PemK/MazF family toxin [Clostridium]MBS5928471.1 type II toxin-antitoxin system PemK/MazF family toxin [Clostridium sp.]MBS6889451.1 type II toxin-antitoxin system PemK/MazF family toxin [Clostridium sp.]MDU1034414.1 type II toxin-antitoxin system PemK/MazF family toxin [Clostridium sp.]MDU2108935.1 type II toxin-antitoxin system PemK/MazF family toxin [Clostridium sp.]MDU3355968.1 type II toxin-antitoxin system PemK/MazF family toxin [Clostridiu